MLSALAALSALLSGLALNAEDRYAFRQWFCYIAETSYYRDPLPAEISDCAALVRYAFREALKRHTPEWKRGFAAPRLFDAPDVRRFKPPSGGLFFTGKRWAEFADALTLRDHNTVLAGREPDAAQPADLLFFYQPGQKLPFHLMIFLGRSSYGDPGGDWVVYHTGDAQGMRKVRRADLMRHPESRWRPIVANPSFLGYYRLRLLQ